MFPAPTTPHGCGIVIGPRIPSHSQSPAPGVCSSSDRSVDHSAVRAGGTGTAPKSGPGQLAATAHVTKPVVSTFRRMGPLRNGFRSQCPPVERHRPGGHYMIDIEVDLI